MNELQRQQWLMHTLQTGAVSEPQWLEPLPDGARGLRAYTDHAMASAQRSLSETFPTLLALLGEESMGVLARHFWRAAPPQQGDLAQWGEALPGFIAQQAALSDWPYLADSARLDWHLAQAERSADVTIEPNTLHLLGEHDPAALQMSLHPSCSMLQSAHPVVSIWLAHQRSPDDAHRFDGVPLAQGQSGLVWRQGWRARVHLLDAPSVRWVTASLRGDALAQALMHAGADFDFEAWLVQALELHWLWRVRLIKET